MAAAPLRSWLAGWCRLAGRWLLDTADRLESGRPAGPAAPVPPAEPVAEPREGTPARSPAGERRFPEPLPARVPVPGPGGEPEPAAPARPGRRPPPGWLRTLDGRDPRQVRGGRSAPAPATDRGRRPGTAAPPAVPDPGPVVVRAAARPAEPARWDGGRPSARKDRINPDQKPQSSPLSGADSVRRSAPVVTVPDPRHPAAGYGHHRPGSSERPGPSERLGWSEGLGSSVRPRSAERRALDGRGPDGLAPAGRDPDRVPDRAPDPVRPLRSTPSGMDRLTEPAPPAGRPDPDPALPPSPSRSERSAGSGLRNSRLNPRHRSNSRSATPVATPGPTDPAGRRPPSPAAPGPWPALLDDAALWQPPGAEPELLPVPERLDEEQRGLPWNG